MAITVKLNNKNTAKKSYTLTSQTNTVSFINVEHGTYQVELNKDGAVTYVENLVVDGKENITINGQTHIFINDNVILEKVDGHINNLTVHVTTTDKTRWNGKQDTVIAGTGITKNGNTLSVDMGEIVAKAQLDSAVGNKMNLPYLVTVDSTTKIHTITHNRKTLVPIVKCYMDNVEFLPWEVKIINENILSLNLGEDIPGGKQIRVGVV